MDSVDLPSRGWKAAPTVTPRTVAYSDILIYDLLSGKGIAVIQLMYWHQKL